MSNNYLVEYLLQRTIKNDLPLLKIKDIKCQLRQLFKVFYCLRAA